MPKLPGMNDEVYFGEIKEALPDWRRSQADDSDEDDDPTAGAEMLRSMSGVSMADVFGEEDEEPEEDDDEPDA